MTVGDGKGLGTSVALGVGDGTGDGDAVGTGVIVGRIVAGKSVGTGRGVVIGTKDGQPDGNSARLRVVSWLTLAPTSMLYMGMMYRTVPIKQMIAKKLNRALSIELPPQDGRVPGLLIL
jgi:hypothetical protein